MFGLKGVMSGRIVGIVTQIMVMAVVLSVILLFIGIGILLLIHLCIVGRAFGRSLSNNNRRSISSSSANTTPNQRGGFGPAISSTSETGMSAEELRKLPLFEYKSGGMYAVLDGFHCNTSSSHSSFVEERFWVGGFDYTECAVCLDVFQFGDRCRVLPVCGHSFHAGCVDAWLTKKPVCPICRTKLLSSFSLPFELSRAFPATPSMTTSRADQFQDVSIRIGYYPSFCSGGDGAVSGNVLREDGSISRAEAPYNDTSVSATSPMHNTEGCLGETTLGHGQSHTQNQEPMN